MLVIRPVSLDDLDRLYEMAGRVELRGLWFEYTPGVPVLKGIDLLAAPGRSIELRSRNVCICEINCEIRINRELRVDIRRVIQQLQVIHIQRLRAIGCRREMYNPVAANIDRQLAQHAVTLKTGDSRSAILSAPSVRNVAVGSYGRPYIRAKQIARGRLRLQIEPSSRIPIAYGAWSRITQAASH